MTYGGFKYLPGRTASGKVRRHEAFNFTRNTKQNGYQCGIASIFYNFF